MLSLIVHSSVLKSIDCLSLIVSSFGLEFIKKARLLFNCRYTGESTLNEEVTDEFPRALDPQNC